MRLGHDVEHLPARVQAGVGSWKIICMRRRSVRSSRASRARRWPAVEAHAAARGRVQAHQQPRHGALAAAGFAHQRQRLALADGKLTPSTACTNWRGLRSTTRLSQGARRRRSWPGRRPAPAAHPRIGRLRSSGLHRSASRRHAWPRHRSGRAARTAAVEHPGQRGLKAQPFGIAFRRGIAPSICSRRSRSMSIDGIEPIRPTV
jgi:hypothetical protein